MNAPVSQMEGLRNRQFATISLLLELASVGALEEKCVSGSSDQADDVEAEHDAICSRVDEHLPENGNADCGPGRLTSKIVVWLVLGTIHVGRCQSTEVSNANLECGFSHTRG